MTQRRGWPFGTHRALNIAVHRLSDENDDPSLELAFGVAQKFHANFHHKLMEDFEYDSGRPAVREFVEKMQALMNSH